MNLLTHLCLAHVIRREIQRHSGARLNYIGFLFGNILPDLSEYYQTIPHYLWTSFSYILDKGKSLSRQMRDDLPYNSFPYAKNLGVVSHYISDYFCFAHSKRFTGNLFKHYIYEWRLAVRIVKGIRAFSAKYSTDFSFFNPEEMEVFVRELYESHHTEPQSFADDIAFALYASTKVASSLLARTVYCQESEVFNRYEEIPEQSLVDVP